MTIRSIALAMGAASALALGACNKKSDAEKSAAPTENAQKAAGSDTIAAGIDAKSKFMTAAKAAGLDATLAGPGPYTVLVPTDAAFDKLPAGTLDGLLKPENKPQLAALLTYHILPGTMLVADIGKAIDAGKGKTLLPTMGGGTITATKDGDKIVLTDAGGGKATIGKADEKRSNGVVQEIDGVLQPGKAK
ncbi:fasciclin domain-containing protein [Sphingomonas sp. ASV193]|uniref:fasciclin domain-containing protein n=1 Tax=Sphingomonas sp. ASV193 TaxID=3144405 RepID=UPI0032E8FD23